MAFFIRIERQEDLEWLRSIMDNSVAKLRQGSSVLEAASENIVRVHEAVIGAVEGKNAEALGITEEFSKEELGTARKPRQPADDYLWNYCEEHPKNQMKRAPSTGCRGCWKAYKRLHPEKYDAAYRRFKLKNK